MKKIKQQSFRKGQFAKSSNNTVLITGAGDKKTAGYPCFAGVVVIAEKQFDNEGWPVGTYSETWTRDAFKKTSVKIQPA